MPTITITDLSGGRNGVDSPISDRFPFTQVVDAVNIDYSSAGLGEKRAGSYEFIANSSGGTAFTSDMQGMIVFDKTATTSELWATDTVGLIKRVASGSTTWSNVSIGDGIQANP